MELIQHFCDTESARGALFTGKLVRILAPEEMLSISSERDRTIWVSGDATSDLISGISWKDKEMFRFPTGVINNLIGLMSCQLVISEWELAIAAIAVLLWGICRGMPRIVVLCTDNLNVFQWLDTSKSRGLANCPLLRLLLRLCIEVGVGIIPRYIRSLHRISADGLTRWSQYECEQWMYAHGMHRVELPELWLKWETEWEKRAECPPLNAFELLAPLYQFYLTYRMRVVEWRSHMFGIARILNERNAHSQYLEIRNRAVSHHLPESDSEYSTGGDFLLLGTGGADWKWMTSSHVSDSFVRVTQSF